jgi:hypothetical protein
VASYGGGGVFNERHIVVNNSTISSNTSWDEFPDGGVGIRNVGESTIKNTIIAGNVAYSCWTSPGSACPNDCSGVFSSGGHNIIGAVRGVDQSGAEGTVCFGFEQVAAGDMIGARVEDVLESKPVAINGTPMFAATFSDNGGPTPTIALTPNSPAQDAIPLGECTDHEGNRLLTDQRGITRPQGAGCDVGSFESAPPRGTGFWRHQCSGMGHTQVTVDEMRDLFDKVAEASAAFPECVSAECESLAMTAPRNDMREKAEMSLLGLWLNVVTGRVSLGSSVDLTGLTTAGTVGEAIDEVERTVCDPGASRGELGTAKEIAEAINNQGEDMEVVALESSATILPGATRTFTLAVVNMSDEVRSYDLGGTGTWPVTLSATRVNGVGPGAMAMFTATLIASGASPNQMGEIRIEASDRNSNATLERLATIRILVGGQKAPTGGRRLPRVE